MFTTGSKYFYGLAVAALIAALGYGIATSGHEMNMDTFVGVLSFGYKGTVGDQFGYSVLMGLFGTALFLGGTSSAFRDADPEATAQYLQLDAVPETTAPQGASYWPIVAAFGATATIIGVVVGAPLVILGAAMLGVAAFEWAARAWSERATGDPAVNKAIRNRVLLPIEIPLFSVIGIAVFVLAVSRILLTVSKFGAYLVFGLVPTAILAVGWYITAKPKVNQTLVTVVLLLGGIGILAGGIASAAIGPRDIEHHEEEHEEEGSLGVLPGAPVVVAATSTGQPA